MPGHRAGTAMDWLPGVQLVPTVKPVPLGFTVPAGSVAQVTAASPSSPNEARAWGYLSDQ